MAELVPIIKVASGILGIFSTVKGLKESNKKPEAQALPKVPAEKDSTAKADEDAKKRRRAIQNTDITRGAALVPQLNVEQKSVLGY